ncbi:MAG: hypothetical protein N4A43_03760 [Alphaproteobacteria bacterium]|jgi:hypothetical protein|nr:hypothetical protein [Alphaproteobacteria bacterium]
MFCLVDSSFLVFAFPFKEFKKEHVSIDGLGDFAISCKISLTLVCSKYGNNPLAITKVGLSFKKFCTLEISFSLT